MSQLPLPFSHLLKPRHLDLTKRQITRLKKSRRATKLWRKGDAKPWGRNKTLIEKINERTILDQETGCWIWAGSTDSNGYPTLQINGRKQSVHRFVCELVNGHIPAGYDVDHTCFNRRCIRPQHLESVTPEENLSRALPRLGCKPVVCIDDQRRFQSIKEAARAYRRDRSCVRDVLRGKQHTAAGKRFAFA